MWADKEQSSSFCPVAQSSCSVSIPHAHTWAHWSRIFTISHPIPVISNWEQRAHEDLDPVLGVTQTEFFPLIQINFRWSPWRNALLSSTHVMWEGGGGHLKGLSNRQSVLYRSTGQHMVWQPVNHRETLPRTWHRPHLLQDSLNLCSSCACELGFVLMVLRVFAWKMNMLRKGFSQP